MKWGTTPEADADLIAARQWIESDNPEAAQRMLATARECFELAPADLANQYAQPSIENAR